MQVQGKYSEKKVIVFLAGGLELPGYCGVITIKMDGEC